jgi:hypothetical protein
MLGGDPSSGGGGHEPFTGRAAIGYDHGYDGETSGPLRDVWSTGSVCAERVREGLSRLREIRTSEKSLLLTSVNKDRKRAEARSPGPFLPC